MNLNDPPLVSIIIPIYKVEEYLPICIDSVVNQTYGALDIILVNDGSPDASGDICEEFRKSDDRIRVIHKQNGGLSDARNVGVELALGEYVFYLDSDDWLESHCIETLVYYINDKSIVQANFYYAYDDHLLLDNRGLSTEKDTYELDTVEALRCLINNDEIKNFAWGKLLNTQVAKQSPFPKGRLFEDTFWTHHVIANSERYVVTKEPLMFYRQRSDSISYTQFDKRKLDRLDGLIERRNFIKENFPALSLEILTKCLDVHIEMYFQAKLSGEMALANKIKLNFEELYRDNNVYMNASRYKVFSSSPSTFHILSLFKRMIAKCSRIFNKESDGLIRIEIKGNAIENN